MRIGVTGAFGFLGARFVAALLDQTPGAGASATYDVTAFARRTRSNPVFDPSRTNVVDLDIRDVAAMTAAFAGLDAVAHFAGLVDFRAARTREIWDANLVGTARVFDAAEAAGVSRVLYAASVNVLGASRDATLLDERSTPYANPSGAHSFRSAAEAMGAVHRSLAGDYGFLRYVRGAYLDSKLAAWELATSRVRERGLPIVTVLPGTLVGAGDLHYSISDLVDRAWEGRLRVCFPGATSFVDAGDFAEGARLALEHGRAGEGYILSGRDEDNLDYAQFITLVSATAAAVENRTARRAWPIPRAIALGVASAAEMIAPRSGLTRALAESGSARNICSSARARAELGYTHRSTLAESIRACRRFSGENPAIRQAGVVSAR